MRGIVTKCIVSFSLFSKSLKIKIKSVNQLFFDLQIFAIHLWTRLAGNFVNLQFDLFYTSIAQYLCRCRKGEGENENFKK